MNRETILSVFLGFVVLWFGYNEVTNPEAWTGYVPEFARSFGSLNNLVLAHGAVLILAGLGLVLNFNRRIAAGLTALMLLGIIVTLVQGGGLDEIAVRDIGLFGMALALVLGN